MEDAMVTGRMSLQKKKGGNRVLQKAGLNASQAINRMYSRLIEDNSADFLDMEDRDAEIDGVKWEIAAAFVDSLSAPLDDRFASMSDADIRMDRLRSRGLV